MKKIFVHLGGGAGDLDPRSNYRCGFTEFIKKRYNSDSKIFAVEANPLNIDKLNFCYKIDLIWNGYTNKSLKKSVLEQSRSDI